MPIDTELERRRPAVSARALLHLLLAAGAASLAAGELAPPRPISPPGLPATDARLATGGLDHAFVAMVAGAKVRVRILGSALSAETVLSEISIPEEDPAIEVGPRALAFVAFAREDHELGARGREVFLAQNPGGSFGEPVNISRNRIDDRAPRLALDRSGSPRLVWVQESGAEATIVHYDHRRGEAEPLVAGERAAIAVDLRGRSHIAFQLGGRLLLLDQEETGFGPPAELDSLPAAAASEPAVGVDARGRIAVVYRAGDELRLAVRSEGELLPLRVLDHGLDPQPPRLDARLGDGGRLIASYLKGGEIRLIRGGLDDPIEPQVPWPAPGATGALPSAREDGAGNLHLVFLRDGAVHYANDAAPPVAEFSAVGIDGELPLGVQFHDLSTGQVRLWRWSFGDGGTSFEREPAHTYLSTGRYTVSLEVFGPGGESRIEKAGLVTVREPSNTLHLPEVPVLPGQRTVWVPVLAYHREPIQAFQVAGRFNPRAVRLREMTLEGTATRFYEPEFFVPEISLDEGTFTAGVVLDYNSPFDGRTMLPGTGQRLLHLVLDVADGLAPGEELIELGDGIGPSRLGCVFVVEGTSRYPVLSPGKLRVLPGDPPRPRAFLRGDTDSNGVATVTDAVLLVGFLFLGNELLSCADAADSNDSGEVDISDVIHLLGYLYLMGQMPPLPHPAAGLDPTADSLPACTE